MNDVLAPASLRHELGRTWLVVFFGIVYMISQVTILVILDPIADAMIKLQTTGFSASDYLTVFRIWDGSGGMPSYRAHFILDDYHWIWYSLWFTSLLCWLYERQDLTHKHNWVLVLPLASGLLDWYENHLQHVFLSAPDFATIVDPLPLFSTIASDVKWLLAAIYIVLSVVLAAGLILGGRPNARQGMT